MPIIHEATGTVDGVEKTVHVVYAPVSDGSYEFPDGFDLTQAIHDAALQYALSQLADEGDAAQMSYMDFVLSVPQEFCAANGFRKWIVESSAKPFNGNTICFTVHDVVWNRNREKTEQEKKAALGEVFAELGYRLGALRYEVSAISGWNIQQIAQQMLLWSQEFVEKADTLNGRLVLPDIGAYVNEKLELLENSRNLEPPEVKPAKKPGKRTKK